MAVDVAPTTPLGLNGQVLGDRWIQEFLSCGCLLASPGGKITVGWGDARRAKLADRTRLSIYAPDFLLRDDHPWITFAESAELDTEEAIGLLQDSSSGTPQFQWKGSSFDDFAETFEDIQARIRTGSLAKAVPVIARHSDERLTLKDRAAILSQALRGSRGYPLIPYGFWTDGGEGMIGVSPELLFSQEQDGRVSSMALAGTRRVDSDGESLLQDAKERVEHQIVVDGIAQRLAAFGSVELGETVEMQLPALIHLHTPILVNPASDTEFEQWVRALHPTPAIGAWPRESGWRWLCEQKNALSRRRFGAPFGMARKGSTVGNCIVAIRNVQWTAVDTTLMAGCGIVAASKLEREWAELNAKLDSVQTALGL